ncbi:MAG: hypothetical protein UR50_C0003G0037 [Parcubacteria group bacterium GW2011_GWC1_34_10]|nr:MAG: hypothetical protein UR50_C0003G0037 [Parcubacteria group bacterium GW2011_GWC1_34_10]
MKKEHWSDGILLWVVESTTHYRCILDGGIMATAQRSFDNRYRLSGAWGAEGVFDSLADAMNAVKSAFENRTL